MAHAFKITPAKSAFGNIKESIHQSDYIDRVKHKNSSCGRIKCPNATYHLIKII